MNYSDEKLEYVYAQSQAAKRGNELHALAHHLIRLGVRLPDTGQTLNLYVNDAIGYRMKPEQLLVYSNNAFGTADAISFNEKDNKLRIFDLKTGVNEASMTQLEIYTAFFCLEYGYKPFVIDIDLRIYQNDQVKTHVPDPDDIFHIMDRIVTFDRYIAKMKEEMSA